MFVLFKNLIHKNQLFCNLSALKLSKCASIVENFQKRKTFSRLQFSFDENIENLIAYPIKFDLKTIKTSLIKLQFIENVLNTKS